MEHVSTLAAAPQALSGTEAKARAIILDLQEAARLARLKEETAKAEAARIGAALWDMTERLADLEMRLAEAEERALDAEAWMLRVGQTAKLTLLDPLIERSTEA